jgi:nucleoside-diphosphate kinase
LAERTFAIIKPDAVDRGLAGEILARISKAGFTVQAMRLQHLTRREAEGFYAVHKERPFFGELVEQMIAAPVVVQVLEGENAILKNREVMGATNPANAAPGTIRKDFAESIEANSVHGSDSTDNAKIEIGFFFSGTELVG